MAVRLGVYSRSSNLRVLDEVLQTKNGTAALRRGLPLQVSLDIAKGDERLFREALIAAKQSLQEARGKLLTGYTGEHDLLQTAEDNMELSDSILQEMEGVRQTRRRQPRARSRAR
jgi:hypothetical protein